MRAEDADSPLAVHWSADDLDRCEHGRHSLDPCADCPDGRSTGNLFLLGLATGSYPERIETRTGSLVRIGTTRYGSPIYVNPKRRSL
jgi:hypothetical protein